ELYGWQGTVTLLGERYYAQSPLMPEQEETLDWIVQQDELLVEMFNDHLEWEMMVRQSARKRKPALPKPIDIAAVKRAAQPSVQALVRELVDMARAEACEMMGEKSRALAFTERHL